MGKKKKSSSSGEDYAHTDPMYHCMHDNFYDCSLPHYRASMFTCMITTWTCDHCIEVYDWEDTSYDSFGYAMQYYEDETNAVDYNAKLCKCKVSRISFVPPIPEEVSEYERPYFYITKLPKSHPDETIYDVIIEKPVLVSQLGDELNEIELQFTHVLGSLDESSFRDELVKYKINDRFLANNPILKGCESYYKALASSLKPPVVQENLQKECAHVAPKGKKSSKVLDKFK